MRDDPMTPLERYRQDLQRQGFIADPAQEAAARSFDTLHHALLAPPSAAPRRGWLDRLRGRPAASVEPVRGLYLWGSVGRGKTYLMDAFHAGLPPGTAERVHFHRFMRTVHAELAQLEGIAEPLETVAGRFAARARVLCLDEFIVLDIGDAMLLAGLLDALFRRGVTLVATSNTAPRDLYRYGLQRDRFLPAIELICRHTVEQPLAGDTDFRLRALERLEIYHHPLDDAADAALARAFDEIAPVAGRAGVSVPVEGRDIPAVRIADDAVWFDFAALCDGPRSPADYLELARCFHTVLLAGIPRLGPDEESQARRFVHLIDVLYDHNVKLVATAAAPPAALYHGRALAGEFARTASRLIEMQSQAYLARGHRA